jgi:periplasmic copper chaperone A
MHRLAFIAASLFALAMPISAQGETVKAGDLTVSSAWARATPKGASVGGGYMSISNAGTVSDRLLGGVTDVADQFELHEMTMDNGVMRMRSMPNGIEIKPGQTVLLDPSGYHVMLVGLKKQLVQGDHFKATLQFAKAGRVEVDFTVQAIGAQSGGHDHNMRGMGGMQMK